MREWQILLCALIFDFLNNIHHSVWGMVVNSLRTSDEHIFHSQEWNFLLAKVAFYIPHHTPCIVDLIIKYYLCHTLHGVVSRNDFPSQFASHLYIWSEVISQSNPPRPHFWMTQGRVNSKKRGCLPIRSSEPKRSQSYSCTVNTESWWKYILVWSSSTHDSIRHSVIFPVLRADSTVHCQMCPTVQMSQ